MSNQGFNEIMEATLTTKAKDLLIKPDSSRYNKSSIYSNVVVLWFM